MAALRRHRYELAVVGLITAAAAALRFSTLGVQSYWFDEAVTVEIVKQPVGQLFHAIANSESTPPLYYMLAWLWRHAFGTGEVGLRSLSALAGTATVPAAYLFANTLLPRKAAYVAAALVAFNPNLIWYSQEARSYALFVLLVTVSQIFFARALVRRDPQSFVWWAVLSVLALMTHYFAVFFAVVQGGWLLFSLPRRRPTFAAAGAVAAVAVLLIPLAVYQERGHRTGWIRSTPLEARLRRTAEVFAADHFHAAYLWLVVVLGLAAVLAAYVWCSPSERTGGRTALIVGLASLALPLGISLVARLLLDKRGDFFLSRNVEPSLVLILVGIAAAVGARRLHWFGPVVLAALCAAWSVVAIDVARRNSWQRSDWRAVAAALDERRARAVVVIPSYDQVPLRIYRRGFEVVGTGGAGVRDLVVIKEGSGRPDPPGLEGDFRKSERRTLQRFTLISLHADRPVLLKPPAAEPGVLLIAH